MSSIKSNEGKGKLDFVKVLESSDPTNLDKNHISSYKPKLPKGNLTRYGIHNRGRTSIWSSKTRNQILGQIIVYVHVESVRYQNAYLFGFFISFSKLGLVATMGSLAMSLLTMNFCN